MKFDMIARPLCLILSGFALCLSSMARASASIYTVTAAASGGMCTANSTTNPNCTLEAAIRAAASGDVIHFSQNVQTQTIAITDTFPRPLPASMTIDASPNGVILDGGGSFGIFAIPNGLTVVLSHLTLQHGLGQLSGGALYNAGGNVTIDSCTLANNAASEYGGAIDNQSGSVTITNTTISDNTASDGAGIFSDGTLVVGNSTIAGNYATGNGGGIASNGTLTLMGTIIAANISPNAPDIYNFSTFLSIGGNVIGNGAGVTFPWQASDQVGTGTSPIDPKFMASGLHSNGGATPTLGLQSASPARNTGYCSGHAGAPAIATAVLDQRGFQRGTPCTAGAFDLNEIFHDGLED